MSAFVLRPRFSLESDLSGDEILDRLHQQLERNGAECTGSILPNYAILRIPADQQHFWSPQLTVELYEEEASTRVSGLVGPRPAVWTMFASFYALAIFAALISLMWGLSQWQLGLNPFALWIFLLSLVLLGAAYLISAAGQKLGAEQIEILHRFFHRALANE